MTQTPTLGRIVLVPTAPTGNNGAGLAPAIVTRVWSSTMINVRIINDGPDLPWRTSLSYTDDIDHLAGTDACSWTWPPRT